MQKKIFYIRHFRKIYITIKIFLIPNYVLKHPLLIIFEDNSFTFFIEIIENLWYQYPSKNYQFNTKYYWRNHVEKWNSLESGPTTSWWNRKTLIFWQKIIKLNFLPFPANFQRWVLNTSIAPKRFLLLMRITIGA